MIEHEILNLEVKVGEVDDSGTFEGVASVFGTVDLVGDQVAHGAFTKSLDAHRRAGRMPLLLWMHDIAEPIGKWLDIRETAQGLMVKGKLTLGTTRAREAYELLKDGALSGLSIGFRTVKAARTRTGRLLQELDLAEISLVSLPALPSARVHSVKSTPRREPAHPMKDTPEMTIDLALPDTPEEHHEFPTEIREQIAALETKIAERDARLDKIETRLARPGARIETKDDQDLTTKAFDKFLRRGLDGMQDLERKVLTESLGSPADGGFWLVPETFVRELQRNLVEISPMRQIARVTQVAGNPVRLPRRTANLTAGWVGETLEHGLSEPAYAQQEVPIFEARVSTEVTNALLEDSAFELGAELARDFAEEFARLEGVAFVNGNGTTQPEGFLTSSDFTTITGGAELDADDLINLYYSIPSTYASRGTWVLRRETIGSVRKLKTTGTGVYLWTDSLAPGAPPAILGRPVVEMPDLQGVGSPAAPVIAFGDWNRAYRVFDRVGLEVLRDPYSKARNSIVTFHARRRVGGALVDGEAVNGLSV